MLGIHEAFNDALKENLKPEVFGARLISIKLESIGIILTPIQQEKIKEQLSAAKGSSFYLEFEDDQVINAGFASKKKLRKALENVLGSMKGDIEIFIANLEDNTTEIVDNIAKDLAVSILDNIKSEATSLLRERSIAREGFVLALEEKWGAAIDLLEMFIGIAFESGELFNREYRPKAKDKNDYVFDVLVRLHARACQIASEILVLLKNGYADGAHARWRTIHEIAVVGNFVANYDSDLAERYILHQVAESYKAAKQYQEYCIQLGATPMTEEEMNEIKEECKQLVDRYGKSYKNSYGWASSALNKDDPTFRDIEESVCLDHMRPYYKMASYNVHANPKGVFFKLGLLSDTEDILLAGPSNVGLADPGHCTAISLGQITITLLMHEPQIDALVISRMLLNLMEEVGEAFYEVGKEFYESE